MYSSNSSISIVSPLPVVFQAPAEPRRHTGSFGRALATDRSPWHERAFFLAFFACFAVLALSFLGSVL